MLVCLRCTLTYRKPNLPTSQSSLGTSSNDVGLDIYAELEYQRRHLVDEHDPKSREMILSGINRLLDGILDGPTIHLNKGEEYVEYAGGPNGD